MKSRVVHSFPADVRASFRSAEAVCVCGEPASEHNNHLGPCAKTGCKRWTWPGPDEDAAAGGAR